MNRHSSSDYTPCISKGFTWAHYWFLLKLMKVQNFVQS